MATPASLRLPWRAISRQITASPISSTSYLRAQHSADRQNPVSSRRYESNLATASPPASEEPPPFTPPIEPPAEIDPADLRLPRAVQAAYLRPLRHEAEYGVPSCDLQLRTYSIRNLELFSDFAMRAAYYLGLPAYGPVPLPRIVERWTVPKGSFIHKKAQENFERKTLRRLIQIKDGNPESVEIWLAFLKKHCYYGIGMKANVWNYEKLGVGKTMDANLEEMQEELDSEFSLFGPKVGDETAEKVMELVNREDFRAASGGMSGMIKVHPSGTLGSFPEEPRPLLSKEEPEEPQGTISEKEESS